MKKTVAEEPKQNEEITLLNAQLEECNTNWKRALADYQNLEKRVRDEKTGFIKFAAKSIIEKLLSVVDDLEKAYAHLKDPGLELVIKKLHQILKEEGVEKIETVGKEYDIETMEAIQLVEGPKDNIVIEEFRPGYTLHGSVLRSAQVKVSKKKS